MGLKTAKKWLTDQMEMDDNVKLDELRLRPNGMRHGSDSSSSIESQAVPRLTNKSVELKPPISEADSAH